MAPKAAAKQNKAQDKAKQTARAKQVEDKTFGLKNKNKSAKVQQYVKTLEKSVQAANNRKAPVDPEAQRKAKKAAEEQHQKELAELFAVAVKQPKLPLGVDPKSVVCEHWRHGQCTKGFKCKYSHDLSVERKTAKIDLFSDRRDGGQGEEETMEDWDQDKLESVVKQKHGAESVPNRTNIICKFFLDAVENRQYGWFWQCPNGKECKYRHALPPGYVLKSQMKELLEQEAENRKAIEDIIEEERRKVDAKTPITEEAPCKDPRSSQVFKKWRQQKQEEKAKQNADSEAERKRKGILTGREIFSQEGFVAEDDISASDNYEREVDEEAEFKRVQEAALAENALRLSEHASTSGGVETRTPAAANGHVETGTSGSRLAAETALQQIEEDEGLSSGDDDFDDEELDALEEKLTQAALN